MTLFQVQFIISSGSLNDYGIAIYNGHSTSGGPNSNTLLGQGPIGLPSLFPGSIVINMIPTIPGSLTFTTGQQVCVSFSKDSVNSVEFCANASSLSDDIWSSNAEWAPDGAPAILVQTGTRRLTRICMNFYGY
jgi:hypothetical protein